MRWSNKPHPGIKPHGFNFHHYTTAHNPLQIVIMSPREKLGSFSVVRLKPDQENLQPLIFVQVKEVLELCSRVFLLQIYIHLRVGALWVKLVKYCVCVCVCNRLFLMSLLSAGYCVSMFGSTEARRTVNAFPCFCFCCCCKKPNREKKGSNLGHNCSAHGLSRGHIFKGKRPWVQKYLCSCRGIVTRIVRNVVVIQERDSLEACYHSPSSPSGIIIITITITIIITIIKNVVVIQE